MKTNITLQFLGLALLAGCTATNAATARSANENHPSKITIVTNTIPERPYVAAILINVAVRAAPFPFDILNENEKNRNRKDYELLTVRGDTALVVLDWAEAGVQPFPFSHATVVHTNTIAEIDFVGGHNLGAMIGALTGLATGIVVDLNLPRFEGIDPYGFDKLRYVGVALGCMAAGAGIGYIVGE